MEDEEGGEVRKHTRDIARARPTVQTLVTEAGETSRVYCGMAVAELGGMFKRLSLVLIFSSMGVLSPFPVFAGASCEAVPRMLDGIPESSVIESLRDLSVKTMDRSALLGFRSGLGGDRDKLVGAYSKARSDHDEAGRTANSTVEGVRRPGESALAALPESMLWTLPHYLEITESCNNWSTPADNIGELVQLDNAAQSSRGDRHGFFFYESSCHSLSHSQSSSGKLDSTLSQAASSLENELSSPQTGIDKQEVALLLSRVKADRAFAAGFQCYSQRPRPQGGCAALEQAYDDARTELQAKVAPVQARYNDARKLAESTNRQVRALSAALSCLDVRTAEIDTALRPYTVPATTVAAGEQTPPANNVYGADTPPQP